MVKVQELTNYTTKIANQVRALLIELSRSGKDRGKIPQAWFEEVINSPSHTLLLAICNDRVVGTATLSVLMGPGVRKVAYLEDFVVSDAARGQGVGIVLWKAMTKWARKQGCRGLEFTCGNGREKSQQFYLHRGAEIYDTNFFRYQL